MKKIVKMAYIFLLCVAHSCIFAMLSNTKDFWDLHQTFEFPETKQALQELGSIYDTPPPEINSPLEEEHVINDFWKKVKNQPQTARNSAYKKILSLKFSRDSYPEQRRQYAAAMFADADPNIPHNEEYALIHAARMQDYPLCKLLLERGANPDVEYNETPALFFVKKRSLAELFLHHNARFTLLDIGGTLLMQSMEHCYEPELVKLYRKKGVLPLHTDYLNGTALHRLAYKAPDYAEKIPDLYVKAMALFDGLNYQETLHLINIKQYNGGTALDIVNKHDSPAAQALSIYLQSHLKSQTLDEKK
jgi:hypothetical protein